jgi:pimeloyl-ACP methyl ester carboxylesterase
MRKSLVRWGPSALFFDPFPRGIIGHCRWGGYVATFVLVHGAWHGGWCWQRVAKLLRAWGHDVFTPTLTGVCERSHLLAPDIDLTTHIADIANLIKWNELNDVVLVGHSYGGMVISGVAEKAGNSFALAGKLAQ